MKLTLTLAALLALAGCSLLSPAVDRAEETAATTLVQSSERVICRDIPVGTWVRMYGANTERRDAWRALCTSARETP